MKPIEVEIEPFDRLDRPRNGARQPPMCMSCGKEVERAAVIYFAHMCRWPDERKHDQVLTACEACLRLAVTAAVKCRPYSVKR